MARGEIRETESVFLYLDGLRPKLPNRQSNDGTVFIAKVIIKKKKHTDFFFRRYSFGHFVGQKNVFKV